MLLRRCTPAALLSTVTLLAAAAPNACAETNQDLRSPDARDVARQVAQTPEDLRSPDARDVARHAQSRQLTVYNLDAPPDQDLPSTEPPVAARGVSPSAPQLRVVHVADPTPTGFDWHDAAIGAATSFGVVLLIAGGVITVSRRRIPTT